MIPPKEKPIVVTTARLVAAAIWGHLHVILNRGMGHPHAGSHRRTAKASHLGLNNKYNLVLKQWKYFDKEELAFMYP